MKIVVHYLICVLSMCGRGRVCGLSYVSANVICARQGKAEFVKFVLVLALCWSCFDHVVGLDVDDVYRAVCMECEAESFYRVELVASMRRGGSEIGKLVLRVTTGRFPA